MLADIASLASAEVAGDVYFGRRFGEREIGGAHTDPALLAEHLFGKVEDTLLHVCERDIFVDVESFDLMENAVRAVRDSLVAEHAARANYANGRFLVLHRADLNRTGVRAQQDIGVLFDEEGILHVAGRMFGWKVQRRENMPVVLDFRAFGHRVTQARKNADDLVFDQ